MAATVISPSFSRGTEGNRTLQQARYQRLLAKIAERRCQGHKTAVVSLQDLEALICVFAQADKALAS